MEIKATSIQRVLDHYYPSPPVPLNCANDFTFLCAVVLSAQTTDGKVNQVTEELFKLASTPKEMAALPPDTVQNIIQPVGLAKNKAGFLVQLSQRLVDEFDGKVPNTYEGLESLSGVGHKTASVVMSQVFGVPAIAVDTHVHRLALRWGLSKEQTNVNKVQQDLCKVFPESCWNKLHLQMIYFGREFCSAKGHENAECPICSWVHRKDVEESRFTVDHLNSFVSKPKTKGIVYYDDRMKQLAESSTDFMKRMELNSPTKNVSRAESGGADCDNDDDKRKRKEIETAVTEGSAVKKTRRKASA